MYDFKKYFNEHRDEMISMLTELVAVPSVQGAAEDGFPFGREPARALGIMLERCRAEGFATENIDNYAGSADLGDDPQLGILCHLDVVPVGDGWTTDPFTLRYEPDTDKLIGRGAIDDKGPATAAFFALKAVKDLGIPLKKGVRLIFGTNEENGSADLAYYRTKRDLPPMVFTPDGEYPVINAEKGMLRVYFSAVFNNGEIHGGEVINAVPQMCSYDIRLEENSDISLNYGRMQGKSAHASTPEKGENAITKFLTFNNYGVPMLKTLSKLFPHGETNGKSCGLGFSDPISGDMTCVLSMLNTVDGRLCGGVDIRFPLDRTKAEISEIICGTLERAGFTVDSCEGVDPHCTDENSPFVQSLLRAYERVTGDKGECIAIGGGTYVHEVEGGVAFGAEFPGEDGLMHSPDEFITVSNLLKNAEIMAEAIVEVNS